MPSSIKKIKTNDSLVKSQSDNAKYKKSENDHPIEVKETESRSFEKAREFCMKTFELLCLTSEQQFGDKKHHGFHDYSVK